jgi:PAS domain S-box-containing protein
MKIIKKFYHRLLFILFITIILITIINLIFILKAKNNELNKIKSGIFKQTTNVQYEIEQTWNRFENDVNYLRRYETINNLFKNNTDIALENIELFYNIYKNLIREITIITSEGNVFKIRDNDKGDFLTDFSLKTVAPVLETKEKINVFDNQYYYNLPVFSNNKLYANILINIDLNTYFKEAINKFEIPYKNWILFIDVANKAYYYRDENLISKLPDNIIYDISKGKEGIINNVVSVNNKEYDVFSLFKPVNLVRQKFGLIINIEKSGIFFQTFKFYITPLILSCIFLILIFLHFLYEVNNLVKSKKQTEELYDKINKIVESLPIGILVTDRNEKVIMANTAAANLLHLTDLNELIGLNINNRLINAKNHISKDTREYNFDENKYVYYDKTGQEITFYKRQLPFKYNEEELLLEGFIDISPIEKARKLEIAANNSKSEFLAKMSHEIRTPMNGIIGMAEVLLNQDLPAETKESLKIISKSADLLLSIINDILDFSKIEAGKMLLEEVPFKLREELNLTIGLFKTKAQEKNIELIINCSPKVPDNIIGDPFRLRQVIANLLSNAIKFTDEGEIILTVEFIKESLGDITLLFTVEDTGIGIPKENIDAIFGSYTQANGSTARKYGGTGLGLTISKQLVELMNGEIWVESPSSISTDPKYPGAKFGFTIEVFSNERLEKEYNFSSITKFSDIKALIISDKNDLQDTLVKACQNFGISVQITSFQKDTLDLIRRNPSTREDGFKIIFITDTYESDGFFITRKLFDKGLADKFLMIMVSSNDKIGNFVKSKRLGIDYYLVKPFELSEIFDIIQDNFTNIEVDDKILVTLEKLRRDLNILVAEDNLINQKVAQNIFKKLGFEIDIAKNGEEAVKMAENKKYDIIFMDLLMPIKNGVEATIEIKKIYPYLPIIAMTADTSDEDKVRAKEVGISEFVFKPVKADTVKKILIKWFSESSINKKE